MKQVIVILLTAAVLSGCGHFRYVATSESEPYGCVLTRNRYRLFQFCVSKDGTYVNLGQANFNALWATFKSAQPQVFADDGKPVAVYLDYTDGRESKYGWTLFCPYILSLCTLPCWDHNEWRSHYSIRFKKPKKVEGGLRNSYEVKIEQDWNMSFYTPSALLFGYGTPVLGAGGQPFYRTQTHIMASSDQAANAQVLHSALAHGAACTLKRLEEDGTLPDIWEETDVAPVVVSDPPAVPVVPVPEQPNGGSGSSGVVEIDSIPL